MSDIQQWAKVDLHCHLEGAFRASTLLKLYQRDDTQNANISLDEFLPKVSLLGSIANFDKWFDKFAYGVGAIKTQADLVQLTYDTIEDAQHDGIIYREIRYAPYFIADESPLTVEQAVEAVMAGQQKASETLPVATSLILIAQQHDGIERAQHIVELARTYGHHAIDIAGAVDSYPLIDYATLFRAANQSGIPMTIHCGEFEGAESVRTVIQAFGARRVGHGFRGIEDSTVLELIQQHQVHLEISVSSNIQTGVVDSLDAHPLRQLVSRGVPISINTDDPSIQGISLTHEYQMLTDAGYFDKTLFYRFNLNAIDVAFTDSATKASLRQRLKESYG